MAERWQESIRVGKAAVSWADLLGGVVGAALGLLLPGWLSHRPSDALLAIYAVIGFLIGAAITPMVLALVAWFRYPARKRDARIAALEATQPKSSGVSGFADVKVFVVELQGLRSTLDAWLAWGEETDPACDDFYAWRHEYEGWEAKATSWLAKYHAPQLIQFQSGAGRPMATDSRGDEMVRQVQLMAKGRVYGRNLDGIIAMLS